MEHNLNPNRGFDRGVRRRNNRLTAIAFLRALPRMTIRSYIAGQISYTCYSARPGIILPQNAWVATPRGSSLQNNVENQNVRVPDQLPR